MGFLLRRKTPPARVCATGSSQAGGSQQELTGLGAEHLVALCHVGIQPRVCSATGASRILNFTEVLLVHHSPTRHPVQLPLFSSGMKSPKKKLTGEKLRAGAAR
jgi:hypothetical protein